MSQTFFSSPGRSSEEEILQERLQISHAGFVQEVMEALPSPGIIVNANRQVLFANRALINMLKLTCLEDAIGIRPGELLSCIHSCETPAGCGTSKACRYCGAVNTLVKSRKTRLPQRGECLLTSTFDKKWAHFEFQIDCTPFDVDGRPYTIMILTDISEKKRKQLLERIFLHDLANQTSNLEGLTSLIRETDDREELERLTDILDHLSHSINDEIISYRELIAAENGALPMNITDIRADEVIDEAIRSAHYYDLLTGKEIILENTPSEVSLKTDAVLLQRILLHMLKNALEATSAEGRVSIGYIPEQADRITFYVKNEAAIPEAIQTQIFQRSFSSRSLGRGIGTYSMKLLGERYLKGLVGFESAEETGTRFFVALPLQIEEKE